MEGFVGREKELAAVDAFLAREGPERLVVSGEPGIGKTSVWHEAVRRAEAKGLRVLSARPVEAESRLAFSGLSDLFEDVPEEIVGGLPAPQRQALAVALLRADPRDEAPDPRAVAAAVRSTLVFLGPQTIVAVDDLQWLDASSAAALAFANRREPLRLLAARRSGKRLAGGLEQALAGATVVELGPIGVDTLHELLLQRLGQSLARPLLVRVHETAGGNPFYALELAREVLETGVAAGDPLPVPSGLRELLMRRVRRLSPASRELLIAAAATARPSRTLLAALGNSGLEEAEAAGIVESRGDRVSFTHPLYAATVYAAAPRERRRRLHAQLSEVVDDQEERARHLALAHDSPDETVAAALEQAAWRAWMRGAPAAAAELLELAVERTPPDRPADRRRRKIAAADDHLSAGAVDEGVGLLESLLAESAPGDERAEVLLRLAEARDDLPTKLALLEQALEEPIADEPLRGRIHLRLGLGWPLHGIDYALEHGAIALRHAEAAGQRRLVARTLARLALWELWAGRDPSASVTRAVALGEPQDGSRGYDNPVLPLAMWRMYQGRLSEARSLFETLLEEVAGDELASVAVRSRLVDVAIRAGDWRGALAAIDSVWSLLQQVGTRHDGGFTLYLKGLVEALLGRVAEARATAELGVQIGREAGQDNSLVMNLGVLGFLDLSQGREREALPHFQPLLDWVADRNLGLATHPVIPFAFEALVADRRLDEARDLLGRFEKEAHAIDSPWALAIADRCRSLLASADGDLSTALDAVERALARTEDGWTFERARTLLVAGRVRRRGKQKAAARDALEQALEIFEALPAPLWADRAREEIARLGARPPRRTDLTETERRVAELAASGLKNWEVAAQLFLSPKTVEANLARIYRKLGIHSRAELGARLAGGRRKARQV